MSERPKPGTPHRRSDIRESTQTGRSAMAEPARGNNSWCYVDPARLHQADADSRGIRRINQPATKGRPAGDETKAENETSRSMSTSALELKRIFSQSDAGSRKNLLGASAWKRSHINVRLPETEDFNS